MARLGISKYEVFAAANQLVELGKEPTIGQIRHILKTGSNSTIAGHLRDWRALRTDTQIQGLHDGVPREMVGMVKGLWERLTVQAELENEATEAKHLETVAELQKELKKFQANNRRWQQLFISWQNEKEGLVATNLALKQEIEIIKHESVSLQIKTATQASLLHEKRLRIEELHRLHLQSQINLQELVKKLPGTAKEILTYVTDEI